MVVPSDAIGVQTLPSDANGVYSLPAGYLAVTGETIQASQHNPPLEDLASAMTVRMMRSGVAPMTGPLKIVDGAVGAPAVQFSNAASTGWYKTVNGIGVAIDGTKVAEFGAGGLVSGGFSVGDLIPNTGSTAIARALCVIPDGRTLSRATYPDLWTFAQASIASGATFYNNGNGSTTFGIGDVRGRAFVVSDGLGGQFAGRVTTNTMSPNALFPGSAGGVELNTLLTPNLPAYTPSGTINYNLAGLVGTVPVRQFDGNGGTGVPGELSLGSNTMPSLGSASIITISGSLSASFAGNAQGGSSVPISNMQPSMIISCFLFAGA